MSDAAKMFLQADRFPKTVIHGFSTRHGGVSQGVYQALNFGTAWGDEIAAVHENLRRLAHEAGFDPHRLAMVRQVHGKAILRASAIVEHSEADGIWMQRGDPGASVVGVRTADCVPLLLASKDGRVVAAVHSGWRGTVENIAGAMVATLLRESDSLREANELMAAVGPCIEVEAFEVGDEVAQRFAPEDRRRYADGRWHVDLVAAVFRQLRAAGIPDDQCFRVGGCSHRQSQHFYSYRREGQATGQMLSFIGFT